MAKWISSLIVQPADSRFLSDLDSDTIRVSKALFNRVSEAVREEPAWILLDEQKAVFNQVENLASNNDGKRHLVLVTGGPGTGKSVIAMQLMGELCRQKISTVHVTNSKSFTTVMKSLIHKKRDKYWSSKAVDGLFRLSHSWVKQKSKFDVAICDEAHRFRKTTDLFKQRITSKRPQAEEIMENIPIVVAFIDEKQILRKKESGTVQYFYDAALKTGIEPENIHGPFNLVAQFRCAGSNSFIEVLDKMLYESGSCQFTDQRFDARVFDQMHDLELALEKQIRENYKVRILGGFCWQWSDPNKDGSLIPDVQIGSWARPWNRKEDNSRNYPADEHPYTIWANKLNNQLGEVGCIYSAQGFEFDYVGVIWGQDLVWRKDRWIAQPSYSCDKEMRNGKRPVSSDVAIPLLKNAYRVLCSRGMRGCYLYCIDDETREYLKTTFSSDV